MHKYGIEIPKNYDDSMQIDREKGWKHPSARSHLPRDG
jgi:hypothetical protein